MSCPPCTLCGYVKYSYQLRTYDVHNNKLVYICNAKCFEVYKKIRDGIYETNNEVELKNAAEKPVKTNTELLKSPPLKPVGAKRLFSEITL